MISPFFIAPAIGYLVGSVPFGYLLIRLFRGEDVRQTGSGNIGATNVARSSLRLGIVTLFLDALKGFAAVEIILHFFPAIPILAVLTALLAIEGHMFPVWLSFRGGKGVATGLGSFAAVAPKSVLVMVLIFLIVFLAFRYVSLGSIVSVIFVPILAWWLDGYRYQGGCLFLMGIASLFIIVKHHQNIRRLLSGSEPRFSLRRS